MSPIFERGEIDMNQGVSKDTIPVRSGEELHQHVLESFLRSKISDLPEGNLEIEQFSAGHSNLTYQLKIGTWEAVLRKPPLGPVAPKAHDMQREYSILSEVYPLFSPAPKPILYSDDEHVVGSPFFIMERKQGFIFDTSVPEGIKPSRELFQNLSKEMVARLVQLHSISYQETRLKEISKPDGFMERQTNGWIARYERAKTDDIPHIQELEKWLVDHIPASCDASIIHYDYKLNNAMFNEDGTEMVGLFDWEMTTVGDPLADLGVAMSYWAEGDDSEVLKKGLGKPSVTIRDGFYTREQFISEYARQSGRDVSNMNFYLTFAYFKLAGICQQIYYRYHNGQTKDPRFASFDKYVKTLIEHAYLLTRNQ